MAGVVVTGAGRGIGAAIAARFAEAGHTVVGLDLDADLLAGASAAWKGEGHQVIAGDAADPDAVGAACALAAAAPGGLGTFVANAGHAKAGPSVDYPLADWDAMIRVHLTGAMVGAQQAAARMTEGGALVMLSSVNGMFGFPGRAAYGAAKAGVAGLVKGLAVEWAPRGLRANAIAPGSVVTELSSDFLRRGVIDEKQFLDRIPMGRFGRVEEIAELVFFLGTPLSSYVTGTLIPIDGGWSAQGIGA